MVDLTTQVGLLTLKNPITVASGTFGSKDEFAGIVDYNALGAVITKSVSLRPYPGNPMPRICETPAGMLNAIGLQNGGIQDFIEQKLPYFNDIKTVLIVSIAGKTIDEYVALAEKLSACSRVDAIEVNISCPNVKEGGISFALDCRATETLVTAVKRVFSRPVVVKLSPEGNIVESARAALNGGADILSLINTLRGMAVDIRTRRPKIANITGGLSGPAIRPIALRCLYEIKKNFTVPVIAMGGIMTVEDVVEFLIVGADAVSLGTTNFVHPGRAGSIIDDVRVYCEKQGILNLSSLRSTLELPHGN